MGELDKFKQAENGRDLVAEFPDLPPKRAAFLAAYAECGNVTLAAQAAGIERHSHPRWLREDERYAECFQQAQEMAADKLESAAWERAIIGTEEPLVSAGQLVTTTRRYSDTLLIFLLKGVRPEKYRERQHIVAEVGQMVEPVPRRVAFDRDRILEADDADGNGKAGGNGRT